MNILLVVPYNVFEAKHGNAIRVRALMETLLRNGNRISLLMWDLPGAKKVSQIAGIKTYFRPVKIRILGIAALIRLLFGASTFDLLCAKMEPSGGFRKLVKHIIQEDKIDVIQCENIWTVLPLVSAISETRQPIIVTAHDVWADRFEQLYKYQEVPKSVAMRLLRSIREVETKALQLCEVCVCVSEEDRRQLIGMGADPMKTKVIPNGVDTSKIYPVGMDQRPAREFGIGDDDIVLFFPGSEMFQNKKAAEDILNNILPELDSRFKMMFAGTICHHLARLDLPEQVILAGYVENLTPLYGLSDVVVLPITIGSGTKLKTVEAMAAGKAVIATPVGAIGLSSQDRESIIVEEDVRAFPKSIVDISQDREYRLIMGRKARENALKYDWSSLMEQYIKIYQQVRPVTFRGEDENNPLSECKR